MRERIYMLGVGASLLAALYFELAWLVYALIGLMLFEGLTSLRAANLFRPAAAAGPVSTATETGRRARFDFAAQRAWHLVMAAVLLVSYVLFYSKLWAFTWFVGFAVTGAGLSGVCPVLMFLKAVGFK
jgi:hypothetical protein